MRRRQGFSLIELLVAIAIIGVLAALLFPVFVNARERAKRTYCVNNMLQIYAALQMYADDNNGFLPPAPKPITAGTVTPKKDGFAMLRRYCKSTRNIFKCPNAIPGSSESVNVEGNFREDPYEVVMADGSTMQCSYKFWPDLYGCRIPSSVPVYVQDYTSGRLDCNLYDKDLKLASSYLSRQDYRQAIKLGGPIVGNYLHHYGESKNDNFDKSKDDRRGVLCLNLKGSIKFVPNSKYPW